MLLWPLAHQEATRRYYGGENRAQVQYVKEVHIHMVIEVPTSAPITYEKANTTTSNELCHWQQII